MRLSIFLKSSTSDKAESTPVFNPAPSKKSKKVGHIKMLVIPDLRKETLFNVTKDNIHRESIISMDASHSHSIIEIVYDSICEKCPTQKDVDNLLPWVHTTIANAKMLLVDTYHGIKEEYLQEYLNEFCRVVDLCAMYSTGFNHHPYRREKATIINDDLAA